MARDIARDIASDTAGEIAGDGTGGGAGDIWALAEIGPDGLAPVSTEIATLVRQLAAESGRKAAGVVVGAAPSEAAAALARYVPAVLSVEEPLAADHAVAAPAAARVAALVAERKPSFIVVGATPDGRDMAGVLSALLGWGVIANATAIGWEDGPVTTAAIFGGRTIARSRFTEDHGIITVRAKSVSPAEADAAGTVEAVTTPPSANLPVVRVADRVAEAGAAVSLEEAKVIVAGGRGVAGPDGFGIVQELADALGGAVGATRAAVDAGWIPYAHQIGQTGKIVRPSLYVALGVSGAIQHKVGMQTAETIIAINRDPDAPIGEFADLFVVGDLFEVVPRVVDGIRTRGG